MTETPNVPDPNAEPVEPDEVEETEQTDAEPEGDDDETAGQHRADPSS